MTQAPARSLPFVDLSHVNAAVERDVLADVAAIIASGEFTNGPHVERFEQRLRRLLPARECVGTASGLDALRLALIARGVGPGRRGDRARPDVHRHVRGRQPGRRDAGRRRRERAPTTTSTPTLPRLPSARAPAGFCPCTCSARWPTCAGCGELAARHGLRDRWRTPARRMARARRSRPGDSAAAAAFSFYPTKNLGALGDAGALVTDDPALAASARALRQHGERERYVSERIGYTARLDTLQAAVLLRKLPLLDGWNRNRREVAEFYTAALEGVGDIRCPPVPAGSRAGVAPVPGAHGACRRTACVPGRTRHPDWAPLRPASTPVTGLRGPRAPRGCVPDCREAGGGARVAADLPGHLGGTARVGHRLGREVLWPWPLSRRTRLRIG